VAFGNIQQQPQRSIFYIFNFC